jgi:Putative DNA-binding domain
MNRAEELYQRLIQGGEKAIDELIADRTSEELFLDFKASPDNGSGNKLAHPDREKLAKAISGFGNSEGGVIVWGVDCDRLSPDGDVARSKRPLENPNRFKSWLEAAVSGCTLPPHEGVRHHVVLSSSGRDEGYLLTLIPKSLRSPHQCIVDPHRHRYYMRVGSNFDHVPHGVLAGMFGRQPQPHIFHMWKSYGGGMSGSNRGIISSHPMPENTPYFSVGFVLRNEGVGVARDLYVNLEVGLPGPECALGVYPQRQGQQQPGWTHYSSFDHVHHLVSNDSFKLAPGAMVEPLHFSLFVTPPFDSVLFYRLTFGAVGTSVNTLAESIPPKEVQSAHDSFMKSDRSKQAAREMAKTLLRLGATDVENQEE